MQLGFKELNKAPTWFSSFGTISNKQNHSLATSPPSSLYKFNREAGKTNEFLEAKIPRQQRGVCVLHDDVLIGDSWLWKVSRHQPVSDCEAGFAPAGQQRRDVMVQLAIRACFYR